MGSTLCHENILQALLIGLIVQIVADILCVFCAFLWASVKKRMARPAADLEMGTVNVGEGATILGVGDDGKLEYTENTSDMRASTPKARIPTPPAQCKNVTEDAERRATVPVVVDVHTISKSRWLLERRSTFANPCCSTRIALC